MDRVLISLPPSLSTVGESEDFQGSFSLEVLKAGPDLYSFQDPLSWQVSISHTGEALLLMGTVEGLTRTSCARCLDSFEIRLMGEVEAFYLFDASCALAGELNEDEYDILPESNLIDIAPHLLAALRLELPLIPLCKDDCKGLCDACGANLNEETCSCRSDAANGGSEDESVSASNPFAVLKAYCFSEDEDESEGAR